MKNRIFRKAICVLLMLTLVLPAALPITAGAATHAPEEHVKNGYGIENEYLSLSVNGGSFNFLTVEGDPESNTDNNARLLYNGTSTAYINLDGVVQALDFSGNSYLSEDETSICTVVNIGSVSVTRIMSFSYNTYTAREDITEFRYIITNNSDSPKSAGVRIMFDTMLGNNDHASFKVNGTDVTTRTEFSGDSIPQVWHVFDDLMNPSVVASGTFYNNISERPDRVQFNNWSISSSAIWDVPCNGDAIGDSAVNIYFDPSELAPGESRTVKTVYGLSAFVSSDECHHRDANDDGHCDYCYESYEDGSEHEPIYSYVPTVMAPQSLVANAELDAYLGNPFTFNAWVLNNGNMPLENVRITLGLPRGFDAGETSSVLIPSLAVGESYNLFKSITVAPQFVDKTFTYTVTISADNAETKVEEHTLFVPALTGICDHSVGRRWVSVVAATCNQPGTGYYECAGCGEFIENAYEPVRGHDYRVTETATPTCTEDGFLYFECAFEGCDASKRQTLPASGHSFGWDNVCMDCGFKRENHNHDYTSVVVEATCDSIGYTEYTCECGYSYRQDIIEMLGHKWSEPVTVTPPTCTEHGLVRYECQRCDAYYETVAIASHDWHEEITVPASCTEDGELTRTCSVCNESETELIPAGHEWSEGTVTLEPTCESAGKKLCVCGVCHEEGELDIPRLGHTYVDGVCTRCGEGFLENVTSGEHPTYGMYFEIEDIISNYGPEIINEYGLLLDHNEGARFDKVAVYLTQDGTMWRRCIACTGENIEYTTYVPYLSYGDDIRYSGLNSDWINVFRLSENQDGIWCYSNYTTIGVNLQDAEGNLLLSLYDVGQAGAETRIFDDLSEMIEWLSGTEDDDEDDACSHELTKWVTVNDPTYTTEGLRVRRCMSCNAIVESESVPKLGNATAVIEGSADYAVVGKDITFTLTVSDSDPVRALALIPEFDPTMFELVSAEWLIDGLVKSIEPGTNRAIILFSEPTDVNGAIFTFTLRAKAVTDSTNVSCHLMSEIDKEQLGIFVLSDDVNIVFCDHPAFISVRKDSWYHENRCASCEYFEVVLHEFDSDCDNQCDACGHERIAPHNYSDELTHNESGHWHACLGCGKADSFESHDYDGELDPNCDECGYVRFIRGDVDGDGDVDSDDSVYLIYNVFFGDEEYPVSQPLDFDKDGEETTDDGIYLLYHVYFGEDGYPLD